MKNFSWVLVGCLGLIGCNHNHETKSSNTAPPPTVTPEGVSTIESRISEYSAWATFRVAERQGLLDGRKGYQGSIERKYNIDIVQRILTYEAGMQEYSISGGVTCIANTDAPAIAATRATTAFLATSTSFGGDGNVVIKEKNSPKYKSHKDEVHNFLSKHETVGLDQSVSRYTFDRGLEEIGLNPDDYKFSNKDPEAAAQLIQIGSAKSAMLWNPFLLQTLRNTPGTSTLFDSTKIPGEIVDMAVMDTETYNTREGKAAAKAICEIYYTVCTSLGKNPAVKVDRVKADNEYEALGAEFSSLNAADMRIVCEQTKFYATPQQGCEVFEGKQFPVTMAKIVTWAKKRQGLKSDTVIAYKSDTNANANLTFDSSSMQAVQGR